MERLGEVTKVDGKYLEITFCRPADCEKCHACMGGEKTATIRVEGTASVGDKAWVELPASTITQASLLAYAFPLAGLFVGMFAGEKLIPLANSLGGVIGAVIGLAIPLGCLLLTEKKRRQNPKWTPKLVRVIHTQHND
jgi:positive regulator of sigma E activity